MKQWIRDRLKQRSTYAGLAVVLSAAGVVVDPATLGQIGAGISALVGLYEMWRDEKSA